MEKNLVHYKPPVIAVLGHVDHGKTTLLDYLRKSRITSGEAGGITQHIGAYQVDVKGKKVTFIDTPGHEAFINLRARGVKTADIALLVIDSAESVKPQTIESIKIIKESGIPMIVALNKIDLPAGNPEKVKKDLLRYDVQTEEHGGKIATVAISAKTGKGIDDLLETILLVAEMKKITTSTNTTFEGVIIESRKDRFKGVVATILVLSGALKTGETVWIGQKQVKVRALFNDLGKSVKEATAGMPVEVLGFSELPDLGEKVGKLQSAPSVATKQEATEEKSEAILSILLKADAKGSLEAITDKLSKDIEVVATGIGEISEGDVTLAKTSNLVVIGFNVALSGRVKKFAEDEGVRIRIYNIIYKLFEEIEDVVEILKKGPQKEIIGQAKIIQDFTTSWGRIAGCQIVEGRIAKGDKIQLVRGNSLISDTIKIASIRQQKDEVTKVEKGKICGILLAGSIDFRVGDMIQSYTLYEF